MLKSFVKIACRILYKNKLFTILNVVGMALGMYLSLLFIALLAFLFRFDNFHPHNERIYRVTTQVNDKKDNPRYASAPMALAQQLENSFTGIEKVARIHRSLNGEAIYREKKIELAGYFADPGFFEIFNFPLVQGSKTTALSRPNTIVLTETEAEKLFGSKDAMGEMIKMDGYGNFLVTGILKDLPDNSHMQFEAVASFATLLSNKGTAFLQDEKDWSSFSGSYVYMRISEDAKVPTIQHNLDEVAKRQYTNQEIKASFHLQQLNDIVPGPQLYDSLGLTWDKLLLFVTGLITLIVLVPACSNFINLSIAQSLERMKEVGVRKVLGGQVHHIFSQFIIESTIVVLVALLIAYVIFEVIPTDYIYQMVEIPPIDLSPSRVTFTGFIVFALLVGVVTGIIPALYFINIPPIDAMKGKEVKASGRSYFRNAVLITQFMFSIGFTMAVVIMLRQQHYSVNYDFGFESENVLDVELQNVNQQIFKHEYGNLLSVQSVSMSSHILGVGSAPEHKINISFQADSLEASSMAVDEAFIQNMKLELLAGSSFSDDKLKNAHLIVVNEEFAKKLSTKDPLAAIGKSFALTDGREVQVAGILKNFHYAGLKEAIKPFYFEYDPTKFSYANLKLETNDVAGSLKTMETLWKNIGGDGDFTAQLFSEEIKQAYSFYNLLIRLWGFLGLLAITVTCLGLLGMVSFSTRKRYKEISIRKIMGASTESLVLLLSKNFMIMMAIASIITVPAMYYLFSHLLADMQHYSIQVSFIDVSISLGIVLVLGLTTILSQTWKAANTNPIDNLKSE
ncbi:ABC transporter permease [Pontibacter akesuensis]|uniref:ABC-type transport system, involved in lipoprotein release, permease component n=1 Tax=Pontibacter akesuensis TaxID=388950 RepID=A0A1I7FGQ1_9BACT|nr:ABC transporter permease [Pontibacter akesuensis]SFU35372.1 ABC-type transport system, involved in lipoprotein release, permease component [Pontibacter akesuensis]